MNLEELLSTLESPIVIRPTRRMTHGELESYLDKAADILRSNADHSEFRGYVFALLFYKRTYVRARIDTHSEKATVAAQKNEVSIVRSSAPEYLTFVAASGKGDAWQTRINAVLKPVYLPHLLW